MKIYPIHVSTHQKGTLAVVGHAGIGHVHSHSAFVQDDSAGFAVVASLMRDALQTDTRIKDVLIDINAGKITVETYSGGIGSTFARRGITPWEIEKLESVIGKDGIYTQKLAIEAFGRMYGQGVTEVPVALQGAIALAVLDAFHKSNPEKVQVTQGHYPGLIDKMVASVIEADGMTISLLLVVNGSVGGIGPSEDNEGNTGYGPKGVLMRQFGMDHTPTIIVESKAYMPGYAKEISENTFLFRAQEGVDQLKVGDALAQAASFLNLPHLYKKDTLPKEKDALKKATQSFAAKIISLATQLEQADATGEKVRLVADLARLISEDAGGISFMTSSIHQEVRSAGIVPGTAAIISLLVPEAYKSYWKIPILEEEDLHRYREVILLAAKQLTAEQG